MSEPLTRPVHLGGRTFEVPRLPLGITILVYPICQRLTDAGVAARLMGVALPNPEGSRHVTKEEMEDLTEVAFHTANAADPELTTETFLSLPITPGELLAAFLAARLQCGAWRPVSGEGEDRPGERKVGDPSPT